MAMPTTTLESPVRQQAKLLSQLMDVLEGHPASDAFRLVYRPEELPVPADHVLVQSVNAERGVMELHPVPIGELAQEHVLHETQVLDPADPAVSTAAATMSGALCHSYTRDDRSTGHLYSM